MVYIPSGYASTGAPYPVIYYLHGLPAGPSAYKGFGYLAATLDSIRRHAILVVPQAARTAHSDLEYLDWSPHENWPQAISHDLTHCIDGRYNTIASRMGRAIMGVSAGGFGALNIGLRHLQTFAAVESWSGYFAATDDTGHVLKLTSASAKRAAQVPRGTELAQALARWPALVGFFVGRSDNEVLAVNEQFDRSLTASHIRHVFRTYPGGHTHSLWLREAPTWLSLALNFLAAPAPA
jgi:enterochelin esterase-like enzyme